MIDGRARSLFTPTATALEALKVLFVPALGGEGKTIEYHGSSYARVNGTKTIEFRFRLV